MKAIKIVGIATGVIAVGGIVFVKFFTPQAAVFTDNVLRPVLGNRPVGWAEKIYYNTSDKLKQLTDKSGQKNVPSFLQKGLNSKLTPVYITTKLAAMTDEGVWKNIPLKLFPDREVMAYTFVRPDDSRPYAFVTLVQIDMSVLRIGAAAGTKQPGGPAGNPGPGKIPKTIVKSGNLVAAFDGGFQFRDGEYGMVVGYKTYLPLKKDAGTLVGYKDGSLKIVDYTGQDLGQNIEFIRQNCPILIQNGQIFAVDERNKILWGRTFNADIYTWRSGIGLTKEGNLIYAVGNNLSPETLARALQMAGAENAIQLDINPFWVRFNIFQSNGSGGYTTSTLTKNLTDGSKAYLSGYEKDFFYVYKNN